MYTYEDIQKEQVHILSFPSDDVLNSIEERAHRTVQLRQATSLGNLERGKVKIRFMTSEGPKQVTTTIWHCNEEHIVLKGGKTIPVRCILEVLI
jgi:hypothetical protein